MRKKVVRSAALLLGLALAAAGCATPDFVSEMMGRPPVRRSHADAAAQHAYQSGYAAGQRDDQRELRADYTRYQRSYDWNTERAFAAGYRDGYGRADDRYVEAPSRRSGSYDDDQGEDEDRRGHVVRSAPDWRDDYGDRRGD